MTTRTLRLSVTIGLAALSIGLAILIAAPIALSGPIAVATSSDSIVTPTGNLLVNPDFENGYSYPLPCCNNVAVPTGWNIRWYTDTAAVIEGITYTFKQPEVKLIDNTTWPFCDGCAPNIPPRIHAGRYAVDAFALFAAQDTTLYQQVGHIPIGATVTGSAWLHAWVSSCNPFPQNATIQLPAISLQGPNDPDNDYECVGDFWPVESNYMLVGIDPWGGTDPRATTVVWNWDQTDPAWWGPYDYYSPTLPVTVTAQATTVTLFLRGVTQMPTKYDDIYFDTASLIYTFPIEWQIEQGAAWPLSTAITIGLQTPVSLTTVSVTLQDPIGQLAPIDFLGSTTGAPYTQSWRFVPEMAGQYRFILTAHELSDPLEQLIEVQTLPFEYQQDHLLSSIVPSDSTLITCVLSSSIALTNLSSLVTNSAGLPLTATLVSSDFAGSGYNFVWQFTTESSGWHTVTLNADEFILPFVQRLLVATTRIYLPIVLRG
jgi:hypothetical protein